MKKYLFFFLVLYSFSLLTAQDFNINTFADTLKYNWKTPEDRYNFRLDLDYRNSIMQNYDDQSINVPLNMSQSVMMPGLGHFNTKNFLRGQILLSAEIVLAGTSYMFYNKSMEKFKKYKNATQIDEINQYYTEASDLYKKSSAFTTLCVALWIYNVYDTYIVTNEYNNKLWINLVEKEKEKRFNITPTGIQINF